MVVKLIKIFCPLLLIFVIRNGTELLSISVTATLLVPKPVEAMVKSASPFTVSVSGNTRMGTLWGIFQLPEVKLRTVPAAGSIFVLPLNRATVTVILLAG